MTSISSTSSSRAGHCPVRMVRMHRTISASPCSMTSAPATGMTVLKWYTGGPSAVTVECSWMRHESAA